MMLRENIYDDLHYAHIRYKDDDYTLALYELSGDCNMMKATIEM
jgi:hypothetical protein